MKRTIISLLFSTLVLSPAVLAEGGCGFNEQQQGLFATCAEEQQEVIVTGEVSPQALLLLPDFGHEQAYQADQQAINALKAIDTPTDIVVIIGTWCPDCHRETPRFIELIAAVNNPNIHVRYIGVDRQKQDPQGLSSHYEFSRIPTFIVHQGNQEIGRIIERPQQTLEHDLVSILKP
ncbi:thioredoxin family protein [Shewanella sp. NIFS-20-20]|uniref:thioredoxin family protein n=1 Tax=Shewanella sp. NIFS-20-20 TaxID=2853806 RepID=UPI001C48B8A4|nr:thioredoxin family protein [Shewanella sp. NIFS-20-20]MBV7316849.1 thioredoxin family protein [Shewanella sp. NIFS-20-20]